MMAIERNPISDQIAKFFELCKGCGAYDDDNRRTKECPDCPIESMRNACIRDSLAEINFGGVR